jgi:hypothetical protein
MLSTGQRPHERSPKLQREREREREREKHNALSGHTASGRSGSSMTASTIPPLTVWPRGTPCGNTQEGPDRLRSAPITDPLSRGFGISNRERERVRRLAIYFLAFLPLFGCSVEALPPHPPPSPPPPPSGSSLTESCGSAMSISVPLSNFIL